MSIATSAESFRPPRLANKSNWLVDNGSVLTAKVRLVRAPARHPRPQTRHTCHVEVSLRYLWEVRFWIAMDSSPPQDMTRDMLDIESPGKYAFLNHSTTTLYHSLPPSVDDRPLARQKRKRTSPEDQAVLEAAYQQDPKPDKTARLEIVNQVALGEKEVQIWFQNRRQSSRRKSRPLMPHEIAKYSFARSEALESGLLPDQPSRSEFDYSSSPNVEIPKSTPSQQRSALPSQRLFEERQPKSSGREWLSSSPNMFRSFNPIASLPTPGRDMSSYATLTSANSCKTNYVMTPNESPIIDLPNSDQDLLPTRDSHERRSHPTLNKTPSLVRISMNADGNAEITTKNASSPSPPRPSPFLWADIASNSSGTRDFSRALSGRSRDSRSWEFWCDKETRSELEHKAEKDASGSATSALGLLRSTSGRSILSSLPSKRNALFSRRVSFSAKRPKLGAENMSLHRSNTSLGRLERRARRAGTLSHSEPNCSKPVIIIPLPGNESDKENWSPNQEALTESGKSKASSGDGATLGCNKNEEPCTPPRHTASSLKRRKGNPREKPRSLPSGGIDPENDPELAAFMHAGQSRSSPSEEDDLDCVQGLLSLSQGNWR